MFSGDMPSLFRAEMGETQVVNIGAPPYTGEYIVTPSPDSTILKTKNTLLTEDVTVEAIPYAEVKNKADGMTVTIGD